MTRFERTDRITLDGQYVHVVATNGKITTLSVTDCSAFGAQDLVNLIEELRVIQTTLFPEYVNATTTRMDAPAAETWPAVERRHGAPDFRPGAGTMDSYPPDRRTPRHLAPAYGSTVDKHVICSYCYRVVTHTISLPDADPQGPRCPFCETLVFQLIPKNPGESNSSTPNAS